MRLTVSTICDSATVREGLLHILGAGITTVSSPIPAHLPLELAVMLQIEHGDAGPHTISVVMRNEETEDKVGELRAEFEIPKEVTIETDLPLGNIPLPTPLRDFRVPKAGRYICQVILDGQILDTRYLLVREQDEKSANGKSGK
ncbi:hypothetical protein [Micromonospora sp. NPDC049240]|uniref:DUF6941 family protein n=1 Tax=Micromonospora sp. NPDC049240 TaxID=3155151 RepID=UPI0033E97F1C